MKALLIATILTIFLIGLVNSASHNHHNRHGHEHKSRHHEVKHETKHHSAKKLEHHETKRSHLHHPMARSQHPHALRQQSGGSNKTITVCPASCIKELDVTDQSSWVINLYGSSTVFVYFSVKYNALLVQNRVLNLYAIYLRASNIKIIINASTNAYLAIRGAVAVYGKLDGSLTASFDAIIRIAVQISTQVNFNTGFNVIGIVSNKTSDFNGSAELQAQVYAAFAILVQVSATKDIQITAAAGYEIFIAVFGIESGVCAVAAAVVHTYISASSFVLLKALSFAVTLGTTAKAVIITVYEVKVETLENIKLTLNAISGTILKGITVVGNIAAGLTLTVGGALTLGGVVIFNITKFVHGIFDGIGGVLGGIAGGIGGAIGGGIGIGIGGGFSGGVSIG